MPLKLVKRPKSPRWIIRGTLRGVRVEESTGTSEKWAAEETRAKREAEILRESIYGRVSTFDFAQASLSFLEEGGSRRFIGPVLDHFRTTPLRHIGQEAVDNAASKLYPHASNATRNRQVYTPVSAILQHAARKGWCPRPVFSRPKMSKVAIRWPPSRSRSRSPLDADAELIALAAEIERLCATGEEIYAKRVDPFEETFQRLMDKAQVARRIDPANWKKYWEQAWAYARESGRDAAIVERNEIDNQAERRWTRMMSIPAATQGGRAAKLRALLAHVCPEWADRPMTLTTGRKSKYARFWASSPAWAKRSSPRSNRRRRRAARGAAFGPPFFVSP